MSEPTLTQKQRAFISAYLKTFNATAAAREAGYSSATASGHENLTNPQIKAIINEHLDSLREEGIRVRSIRVNKLVELDNALEEIQLARAQEAREKLDVGFDVIAGETTGLLVESKKVGPRGTVSEYVVDKALIAERRALMEQVAKELGERIDKLQVSGDKDNPLVVETAKAKLQELLEAD